VAGGRDGAVGGVYAAIRETLFSDPEEVKEGQYFFTAEIAEHAENSRITLLRSTKKKYF
jgi:hypothetical protein